MRKLLVALSTGALLLAAGVSASAKSTPSAPDKACPAAPTGLQSQTDPADAQSGAEVETEDGQDAQAGAGHGKGHAKNANGTGTEDKTDEGQSGAQAAGTEKDDVEKADVEKADVEKDDVEKADVEKADVENDAAAKPAKPAGAAKPENCDTNAPKTSKSQNGNSHTQKADKAQKSEL
jgi:hypothetical protein